MKRGRTVHLPRKARPLDESLLLPGKLALSGVDAGALSAQIWCRETVKQRAVRIDGAGRPT